VDWFAIRGAQCQGYFQKSLSAASLVAIVVPACVSTPRRRMESPAKRTPAISHLSQPPAGVCVCGPDSLVAAVPSLVGSIADALADSVRLHGSGVHCAFPRDQVRAREDQRNRGRGVRTSDDVHLGRFGMAATASFEPAERPRRSSFPERSHTGQRTSRLRTSDSTLTSVTTILSAAVPSMNPSSELQLTEDPA